MLLLLPLVLANTCPKGSFDVLLADQQNKTLIWSKQFYECTELTSVTIEEGIIEIAKSAFQKCINLVSVTFPTTLQRIDDSGFMECRKLSSIELPDGIRTIGGSCFRRTSLVNVTIPSSITNLGLVSFQETLTLVHFEICDETKTPYRVINNSMIFNRNMTTIIFSINGVTEIFIPDGVTTISTHALAFCQKLVQDQIVIPDSVTYCGTRSFLALSYCPKVYIGANAVLESNSLESWNLEYIDVAPGHIRYVSASGVLFTSNSTQIITYPSGRQEKELLIPKETREFGLAVFSANRNLQEFKTEESDDSFSIAEDGVLYTRDFQHLLKSPPGKRGEFTVNSNTLYIDHGAFYATVLSAIHLPSGLKEIRTCAFNWAEFASITIPESITVLSANVFVQSYITSIVVPKSITVLRSGVFQSCYRLVSVTTEGAITKIESMALYVCPLLTSFTFSPELEEIGSQAFSSCSSLTHIEFPDRSLKVIGASAFADCVNLTEVCIPNCVLRVEELAFARCRMVEKAIVMNCATFVHKDAFAYVDNIIPVCIATLSFTIFRLCSAVHMPDVMKLAGLIYSSLALE